MAVFVLSVEPSSSNGNNDKNSNNKIDLHVFQPARLCLNAV